MLSLQELHRATRGRLDVRPPRVHASSSATTYGPYVVIDVHDPDGPAPEPGQFYMLAAVDRWGGGDGERPFLPRAFSVLRARDGRLLVPVRRRRPGHATA